MSIYTIERYYLPVFDKFGRLVELDKTDIIMVAAGKYFVYSLEGARIEIDEFTAKTLGMRKLPAFKPAFGKKIPDAVTKKPFHLSRNQILHRVKEDSWHDTFLVIDDRGSEIFHLPVMYEAVLKKI